MKNTWSSQRSSYGKPGVWVAGLGIAFAVAFYTLSKFVAPPFSERMSRYPTDRELLDRISTLVIAPVPLVTDGNESESQKVQFGKKLFSERALSAKTDPRSCADCHLPGQLFSGGAETLERMKLIRDIPSLLDVSKRPLLHWDGAADSLAGQAAIALEDPGMNGFDRVGVVRQIYSIYADEYSQIFGALPVDLLDRLPESGRPRPLRLWPSRSLASEILANIGDLSALSSLLDAAADRKSAASKLLLDAPYLRIGWDALAVNYAKLSDSDRQTVDEIFANVCDVISKYEMTLVASDSPFDAFAKRAVRSQNLEESLSAQFDREALSGLRVFLGAGGCVQCHGGSNFSDGKFHNLGLPGKPGAEMNRFEIGRALGVLWAINDPNSCRNNRHSEAFVKRGESCELAMDLNLDDVRSIGAFRTPGLRNVELTGPYGHSGQIPDLDSFISFMRKPLPRSQVGRRSDLATAIDITDAEAAALIKFLKTLTSETFASRR